MRKKKKSRRQIEADEVEEEVPSIESEPRLMVLAVVEGSATTSIALEVEYGPDPKSYKEARRDPHSDLWEQAEVEELRSLEANETWTLINLSISTGYEPKIARAPPSMLHKCETKELVTED
ncbi:unnamed protein product [Peronospora farinosa]|uniref:Uncharacterized protein n=1 Tax=Peronospora farinosa TaxID=134698 RepID=A0AAV0SRI1_9STRA|nr:unnamed protein product [Peronospora farinosa]